MFRTLMLAALIALPGALQAQDRGAAAPAETGRADTAGSGGGTGQQPSRIRNITLTGEEKCPESKGDEIVVCSRIDEPYRIPKALRGAGPVAAANQSWVNRAAALDEAGRVAGGLPDTCSPVGTGGQTGCVRKMLEDAAADKRERRAEAAGVP